MKIKLIKRQILDEREEQLVNKAGMGEFQSHAMWQFSFIYGFCSDEWGGVHYQPFLLLILITSFYFMCRT